METARLRIRIVLPLAIALAGIGGVAHLGLKIYTGVLVAGHVTSHQTLFTKLLEQKQEHYIALMSAIASILARDHHLHGALRRSERQVIAKRAGELFTWLQGQEQLSQMYFLDPQGQVILRMHRPELYGDTVARGVVRRAQQSKAPSSGIEISREGTLSLRLVSAWEDNGNLVGFVELGVEIGLILEGIAKELGDMVVVALRKGFLDEQRWIEEHQHAPQSWQAFSDVVLYRVINGPLSPGLFEPLPQLYLAEDSVTGQVRSGERDYRAVWLPIRDMQDRIVAEGVLFVDVTEVIADANRIQWVAGAVSLCLAAGILWPLYRVASRAEGELGNAVNAQQKARDHFEERVASRTHALAESQSKLAQAEHIAQMGSWEWDRVSGAVLWSDELYRLLGVKKGQAKACYETFVSRLHPADADQFRRDVRAFIKERRRDLVMEVRIIGPDGPRFLAGQVLAHHDQRGWLIQAFGTLQNVTGRKRVEISLRRINRVLITIRSCHAALVRANRESELLVAVCRILVETGGYRLAWVGYVQANFKNKIRPVAQFGEDENRLTTEEPSWFDHGFGREPTAAAIRTGQASVVRNVVIDNEDVTWREAALARGYAAAIALPLQDRGRLFGVLTLYAAVPGVFDPDEERLLQSWADDLAYGIVSLRAREAPESA